jgi:hypothetical protein
MAALLSNVAMLRGARSEFPVSLVGHGVNAGGVDPAIVEVKEGANGDGVINRAIAPASLVQDSYIFRRDLRRAAVHLGNKSQERLFVLRDSGGLGVP